MVRVDGRGHFWHCPVRKGSWTRSQPMQRTSPCEFAEAVNLCFLSRGRKEDERGRRVDVRQELVTCLFLDCFVIPMFAHFSQPGSSR